MVGFLQWFAGRYDEVRAAFDRIVSERRSVALQDVGHARTPDIVANLQAAFELYLDFAVCAGALVEATERVRLARRCWEALSEAAAGQAKHQAATEPAARFLTVLRSLFASGRAHLAGRNGGEPEGSVGAYGWRRDGDGCHPLGDRIGWVDGDDIYLEPTAAYRLVQAAASTAGESLPVSEQTLKKRIHEKGLLASVDATRQMLTIRRTLEGVSRSVLHFLRATVLPEAPEGEESDVG
jgi:hypothetical protein